MDKTRQVILTEAYWQKIDYLLRSIPDSNFLRFCLLNDIVELGLERLEELFTMQKSLTEDY